MKEGWKYMKLGDCFISINNGANIKQVKGAKGLPITRIETLSNDTFNRDRLGYADIVSKETYKKYELNNGDILMSHINSMKFLGRSVVYHKKDDEYIIHGMNLLRLVPKVDYNSVFMAYLFMSQPFRKKILTISHQSVNQASFNVTALKGLDIPVPPLSEQQRIVSFLDASFAKIETLKSNAQKNLDNAEQLWKAQLEKQFDNQKWEKKKLGEVIELLSGQDFPPEKYNSDNNGIPYITGASNFLDDGTVLINRWTKTPSVIAHENDILLVVKGSGYGKTTIAKFIEAHIARQIMALRVKEHLSNVYAYYYLNSKSVEIKKKGTGVIPGITRSDVLNLEIPIPPLAEQERIVKELDALSAKINTLKANYRRQIECCDELRQSLLKKAFEGEL